MKTLLTFLLSTTTYIFFGQVGSLIKNDTTNSGYVFNFSHTEISNTLCDGLFNIYHREGTLVTLEQHGLSFTFEKNSILNPSVANKFVSENCNNFYHNVNISQNPIIEVEISASKDCQVGFLVAADVNGQFTYADGHGYKLQKVIGGETKVLRFEVPAKSWRGKKIDLSNIIGWGVQVKGPNGEPLPTLGEGRKINLFAVSFGEELATAREKAVLSTPAPIAKIENNTIEEKATITDTAKIEENVQPEKEVAELKAPEHVNPEEVFEEKNVSDYSNSFKSEIHIDLKKSTDHVKTVFVQPGTKMIDIDSESTDEITVFNMFGEQQEVIIIDHKVKLERLPNGTYILNQGKLSTRFVKQ